MDSNFAAALVKAAKTVENDARDLPPGRYTGVLRIMIAYALTKGEQYEQRIVQAACPWKLLTVALGKLNGATIRSIVEDALATDPEEASAYVKQAVEEAMRELKGSTVRTCAGKLTGQAEVFVIEKEGATGA